MHGQPNRRCSSVTEKAKIQELGELIAFHQQSFRNAHKEMTVAIKQFNKTVNAKYEFFIAEQITTPEIYREILSDFVWRPRAGILFELLDDFFSFAHGGFPNYDDLITYEKDLGPTPDIRFIEGRETDSLIPLFLKYHRLILSPVDGASTFAVGRSRVRPETMDVVCLRIFDENGDKTLIVDPKNGDDHGHFMPLAESLQVIARDYSQKFDEDE